MNHRVPWRRLSVLCLSVALCYERTACGQETSPSFASAPPQVHELIRRLYRNKGTISVLERETEKRHPGTYRCVSELQLLKDFYSGTRLEYWKRLQEELGPDVQNRTLPVPEFDTYKHYAALSRMCEFTQAPEDLIQRAVKSYLEQLSDTDSIVKELGIRNRDVLEDPQGHKDFWEARKAELDKLASDYCARQGDTYNSRIWYQAWIDGETEWEMQFYTAVIDQWIPPELKAAREERAQIVAQLNLLCSDWEQYNRDWERLCRDKELATQSMIDDLTVEAGRIATDVMNNASFLEPTPAAGDGADRNVPDSNTTSGKELVSGEALGPVIASEDHTPSGSLPRVCLALIVVAGASIGACWKRGGRNNVQERRTKT